MPTATFRRYEYRRRLPHYQQDDRPIFVTCRAIRPLPFSPEARTVVLRHVLFDNGRRIHLHAAVVMPDHLHLLFTALRDEDGWTFALPEIMKAIKGVSARNINKLYGQSGPVWQDESFDHVLRGDESLEETVEYIRQNPVRRGLVAKPEDYPWLWQEPCGAGSCGAGTPARVLKSAINFGCAQIPSKSEEDQ
jgi:REP element-mobilizing transposase RayT